MRIKSILFLLVCFLLSCSVSVRVIAHECVPACVGCKTCEAGVCVNNDDECDDCESCVNGSCEWDCDTCYKCESASCVPCKCWDDGDPITGSITAQDALLCEVVIHTSSISDTDHWFLGGNGEDEPTDTISSYSWDQAAGTNPMLGTFKPPTDEATVEWEAPPCKGTVIIRLDADDAPDSMDNPCPDSERDDPNEVFEDTSTVSTGCTDCSGDPAIDLDASTFPANNAGGCSMNCPCGAAGEPKIVNITVLTPCYEGCMWRFGVTAKVDFPYGPCTDLNCYVEIESGSDSDLTEENYCEIVDGIDYTPNDESTGVGCPCVGGEGLACEGGTRYSNATCLMQHEEKHATLFTDFLLEEGELLFYHPALSNMEIDCSDSDTKTCSAAKAARQGAIEQAVRDAYDSAYHKAGSDESEVLAREAAYDCFHTLASEICSYAVGQGWKHCDHCH